MSNRNIITTVLATIGATHLTLNALARMHRAYLTQRLGPEYTEWRANYRAERYRRNDRLIRHFITMCEKRGLTMNARFYRWLVDTVQKLDPDTKQADLEEATRNFQRAQERVNRDRV